MLLWNLISFRTWAASTGRRVESKREQSGTTFIARLARHRANVLMVLVFPMNNFLPRFSPTDPREHAFPFSRKRNKATASNPNLPGRMIPWQRKNKEPVETRRAVQRGNEGVHACEWHCSIVVVVIVVVRRPPSVVIGCLLESEFPYRRSNRQQDALLSSSSDGWMVTSGFLPLCARLALPVQSFVRFFYSFRFVGS